MAVWKLKMLMLNVSGTFCSGGIFSYSTKK